MWLCRESLPKASFRICERFWLYCCSCKLHRSGSSLRNHQTADDFFFSQPFILPHDITFSPHPILTSLKQFAYFSETFFPPPDFQIPNQTMFIFSTLFIDISNERNCDLYFEVFLRFCLNIDDLQTRDQLKHVKSELNNKRAEGFGGRAGFLARERERRDTNYCYWGSIELLFGRGEIKGQKASSLSATQNTPEPDEFLENVSLEFSKLCEFCHVSSRKISKSMHKARGITSWKMNRALIVTTARESPEETQQRPDELWQFLRWLRAVFSIFKTLINLERKRSFFPFRFTLFFEQNLNWYFSDGIRIQWEIKIVVEVMGGERLEVMERRVGVEEKW
jgi:hypothetical protein